MRRTVHTNLRVHILPLDTLFTRGTRMSDRLIHVGRSDTPRIKYIMFLPNTPLLLLATVVRGVNTLLGRADAVMATARGALPRKSITSSVPVLIPYCFAMSRKPDFQPAAQRQLGGLRTILRSLHPQTCAGSDIP